MKRMVLALLCLLVPVLPALAQIDPDPDGIGIYADLAATTVSVSAEPGVIFPVYLCVTRASTLTGIDTWACRIVTPPNAEILAWNVPGWSMNVAQPPEFVVARGGSAHPPAPVVNIMTFYIRMSDAEAAYFYVEGAPLAGQGFDQAPVYLELGDFNTPHFLHSFPSGPDAPSFAVNATLVAVEPTSWGGVKALFR